MVGCQRHYSLQTQPKLHTLNEEVPVGLSGRARPKGRAQRLEIIYLLKDSFKGICPSSRRDLACYFSGIEASTPRIIRVADPMLFYA